MAGEEKRPERPRRGIASDAVIIHEGKILLGQRDREPFAGHWALPGGFIEHGETIEGTCAREAFEETRIRVKNLRMIGVYSEPGRDPRGTVTIPFLCDVEGSTEAKAQDDARAVRWFELDKLPALAFDHGKIVSDALTLKENEARAMRQRECEGRRTRG